MPGFLVVAKLHKQAEFLGGDARIAPETKSKASAPPPPSQPAWRPPKQPRTPRAAPAQQMESYMDVDATDSEGFFLFSKKGKRICKAYQSGICQSNRNSVWCPSDSECIHICHGCRQQGRPWINCASCGNTPQKDGGKGKGKGKNGGGKGRGKKGGKKQWWQR